MVRSMSEKKSNFELMDEMEKENTHVDRRVKYTRLGFRQARIIAGACDDVNMGFPVISIIGLAIMAVTDLIDSESWIIDAGMVIAIVGFVEYIIRFVYRWNKHHEKK